MFGVWHDHSTGDDRTEHRRPIVVGRRKGNNRDTGLRELTDAEISSRAHDKTLPMIVRLRYMREEKCRGLRNRSKARGR